MMWRFGIGLLAVVVLASTTWAAGPTVEAVSPSVGQRGTEFRVQILGARLTDLQTILFYTDGLTCTKLTSKSENEATATIVAKNDCRLGEHPFRLLSKGGASELRTLRITPLPVIREASGDNNTPKQAQAVPLNVTIVGVIESTDVDCYAVTLKKGQRLSAEVEAVRLGASDLDAVLTIYGPDGKVIVEVDDTPLFRQDPLASIQAPVDGTYTIAVRDTSYGGGDNNRYALHVGTFLRPSAIYPAGGPIGSETSVQLFGDPTGERTITVQPKDKAFELYPTDSTVAAPTPNPFRASPFPNILETEPNENLDQVAKSAVAWPIAFNGILSQSGDVDHFAFQAKKGEQLEATLFGYRMGSPIDSVITILDSTGQMLASNDDDETHDSRVKFLIPADGTYFLQVSDKRKQGGPNFIYRVEIEKQVKGLTVFQPTTTRKSQDRQVIMVPRGNRVAAWLAVRRDGVEGPVTIQPESLPEGVELLGQPIIGEEEYLVPVVFSASDKAPFGGKLIHLVGRCNGPNGAVQGTFRQTIPLVNGPGDLTLHSVTVSKLAVVVVEEAAYTVEVVAPATPLVTDGVLDVTVRVQRQPDFTNPLELFFTSLPVGVEGPASVVVPADKNEVMVSLTAKRNADLGNWPIFVEAKPALVTREKRDPSPMPVPMKSGGRRPRSGSKSDLLVSSFLVPLQVVPTPIQATFPIVAAEQGKEVKVVCTFDGKQPLPNRFTARLSGLPPRAKAEAVEVTADMKQIEFKVSIDPTTPLGEHPNLVCELTGKIKDQKVVYRVGHNGSLNVYPLGGVKMDASGRALSPLETLRSESKKKP